MAQTVLIVDDNHDVCELFSVAFTSAGFEVLIAYTGMDAIQLLKEHRVDVMTLDHDMPGKNGIEVLLELHETDQLETTKVVMVTANDAITFDRVALELADLTLLKPVSLSQLIQLASRLAMQAGV